ncbi:rhodanese-like domain-containing protein [Pseudobacillus wudalianchiensis]|uniref:Rhodanese-like domain-containing protein n=1 Tax=Pseudobacillus wudalianchiensis TaxID=1743143 RepID=A0A1B9B7Y6_9BACI|nr:rhodanese-like domain-containing protein [Bacillus wudalianchiensis]OCA92199.1 rhodanese-like domain-containing protein [Bacillus wudalianchiensis]
MEPIPQITPEELKQKLANREKLEIVDVREDEEVAGGKIPEAKHIVMGTIPEHLDQFDKDKEYIFVCRSGRRSENVCYYMRDQGFKVRNMTGGMLEWTGETK